MAEASLIKNKYRILHQVGRGGMGNVYEVVHEGLGTTYALKQLHLELENNPEIASRFRHEAQMMARLQHPNIVRVFDIDSEPGFGTYLLMELIKGVDLGKILRAQGRLKYAEVLRTGLAIASALDTAHRAGLVHRDIKPGNILIEEATTRAVVTDFGIAKQMESDGDDNVTRTGSFIGTYRYCSPEQIRNEKGVRIDGRADVYSLGVVLYEMSSGKKFLDGMSEMQIAHHVGFEAHWKPPLEFPEPPSPDFRRLVDQCLAHDREQRPTAAEVIKRLDQLLESASEGEHQEAIRELRADVAARSEELQRLQQQLEALDVPAAASQQIDDLSRQLEAIKQTEDAGQLQEAHASLQSLKDQLSTSRDELARMLRERLRAMLVDLGTQWDALMARSGEYVTPEQSVQFDGVMQDAERFIASNDWSSCQVKIEEGERFLEQTKASLHDQARLATGAVLEQVRAALDDLRARAGPGATRAIVNLKAVEEEVGGHIDAGRLNNAKVCAEQALAAVTAALHQSLREQRENAAHARSKLADVLAGIDEELARAVAPEQLERASQARSDAAAAEQRRDYAAAAAAYEQAAAQYEAAWQEVSRQQSGQLAAVERELRRLLQRATDAPAVIVGDARAAAQALCDGPRPQKFSEALAAMEQGRARLAAALDEAEQHAEVTARQAAAEAAQQRVRDLGPSRHELRGADQLMKQGAAACAKRQWTGAAQYYAQAVDAFSDLEGRLQARVQTQNETEHAAAARAKLEKLLAGFDIEAARAVAGEELARASAAAVQAAEAEQHQEYVVAAARYAEAAGHYQVIKDLVAEQQTGQLTATQQELRVLLQRAADAPAAIVASRCAPAQAALDASGGQEVPLALAAAERARSGLVAALDEAALYAAVAEKRDAVERRQQRVADLGPARRQLRPAERLIKNAAAAMKKRQWAVARERYQQADTTLATIEEELRSEPTVVTAPQAGMADAATKMIPASEPFAPATIPSFPTTVWIGSAATAVAVA
ncbi:MAG: protein kinase, partial [Candidatus Binatia bacterium]